MRKWNFAVICFLTTLSAMASPLERVITSTGAVFERVPYNGFKNQTTAWKDLKSGKYWSDTLRNRFEDTYDGLGLPIKVANCGEPSEAVKACEEVSNSGHDVHLPTLEEYIDLNTRFEAHPTHSRSIGDLGAYTLSYQGVRDLRKVTDIEETRSRSGTWHYWTSTINPNDPLKRGRFDGATGGMSWDYFSECDFRMLIRCVGELNPR